MVVFRVLGPLEVRDKHGAVLPIPRRKQRELLALLLVRRNAAVSTDEAVDALWGERPPASAKANLYSYLCTLRHILARATPEAGLRPASTPHGYRLDLRHDELDATVFASLTAAGRRALAERSVATAAECLTRAAALWRGPVLAEMAAHTWLHPYVALLEQTYLAAVEDQFEARLRLGRHAGLADEIATVISAHPFRERLWAYHLVALYRCGHRTAALLAYDRLVRLLDAELGVGPDSALRALRRRIADDDTTLRQVMPDTRATGPGSPATRRRQVPDIARPVATQVRERAGLHRPRR